MKHALTLLAFATTACAVLGDGRCDEPDRSCGQPAVFPNATTLRRVRERMPRFEEGAPIALRSVSITAIDRYDETGTGRTGTVWLQEISPPGNTADRFAPCPLLPDRSGRVCAISLFDPTFSPTGYRPVEGELVNVSGGGYAEFTCVPCGTPFAAGNFLPQIARPSLERAGVAPQHIPIAVTLDEVLMHYRELMGVLVTVEDVTAQSDPDTRFGEMLLVGADARSGLTLAPQLTPIPGARNGTRWTRITGIVTYFYNPKLLPRSPTDLEGQR